MNTILIKNGRVIDPANRVDGTKDILIENGVIVRVETDMKVQAQTIIDAKDKLVLPGLVDMHVHLREPGREDKETVLTGTKAALRGGVTSVLAMPNTTPAMDSPESVLLLKKIVAASAQANVFIAGTITQNRAGSALADFGALKKAGVSAVTDDGGSVEDAVLMAEAFRRAKAAGLLVICHCEDKALAGSGVMNHGYMSTVLGLRGISAASETKRVERDLELAAAAGCPVHIAHVSCRESVAAIAAARKKGLRVTAETAPHYFTFTDEALAEYDTNFKMNPPLRCAGDVAAIKEGLKDGTIDAIASDHAPHTENEKDVEFDRAEFGVTGLETELAAAITTLVEPGVLSWSALVEKLSLNPARILGLDRGTLGPKAIADIVIVDPAQSWVVVKKDFVSKSKNSAFLGRTLKGRVTHTICGGRITYSGE
jgi:dihydroorotase